MEHTAYLGNEGRYTVFRFGTEKLRFIAPYSLQRYEAVKEWDDGYMVVLAKYAHNEAPEEEYIDLVQILKDLYMEPEVFLKPIERVEVDHGGH